VIAVILFLKKRRRSWRGYGWIEYREKKGFLRIFNKNVIVGEGFDTKTVELLTAIVVASRHVPYSRVALAVGEPKTVKSLIKKHIGIDVNTETDKPLVVIDGRESGVHSLVFEPFRRYAYIVTREGDRVVCGIAYRP